MTVTHEPGDTVALKSRLLFADDVRREGTVVAVAEDGKVTVEFPQAPYSPMRVTDDAEHFISVRKAPDVAGLEAENERLWAMVGRVHDLASAARSLGVSLDPAEVLSALEGAKGAAA